MVPSRSNVANRAVGSCGLLSARGRLFSTQHLLPSVQSGNRLVKRMAVSSTEMEVFHASSLDAGELNRVLSRPRIDFTSILDIVCEIWDGIGDEWKWNDELRCN